MDLSGIPEFSPFRNFRITVLMPGGQLSISIDENFGIVMVGPVTRIGDGQLADDMFQYGI